MIVPCFIIKKKFSFILFIWPCILNKLLHSWMKSFFKWSITIYDNLFIYKICKHTLTPWIRLSLILKETFSFFVNLMIWTFVNLAYYFFTFNFLHMRFVENYILLGSLCTLFPKSNYFCFKWSWIWNRKLLIC